MALFQSMRKYHPDYVRYEKTQTTPIEAKGEATMANAIIRIEVQVTPQITSSGMQHYWRVFRIDERGNNFTLKDGFAKRFGGASADAVNEARAYI